MMEPENRDWDLINAYCDDELSLGERQDLDARLKKEPALRKMHDEVTSVSRALPALRPVANHASPSSTPATLLDAVNRNRKPLAWCASIAAALLIAGSVFLITPQTSNSAEYWHQLFLSDIRNDLNQSKIPLAKQEPSTNDSTVCRIHR